MQVFAKTIEQPISENGDFVLEAFREGDPEAFRRVYVRVNKSLYYFVQNIIDSPPDAEDIVASSFLKLYRSKGLMQSFEHVKRWLFVIARNESIDHLRSKARGREVQQELAFTEEAVEEILDLEILKANLLTTLMQAIERLPRQRKAILRMYFFEQKTTAEIAERLQINNQTVLNHKTRAIEALRKTVLVPGWLLPGVLGILPGATFFLMNR